ncbi:endoglucanase [Zobellia uliginosa]|uniref:Endoglucanase n=1 Tax=Zobellia uliginosa TaxID=143224 RepID=A0ABY1KML0_9FLAO|nr:glycoside hydrolase family 5 protein [Zobellia uliginosa]SIS50053.1 endoglucanase [Zobellia uliginosa]
MKMIKLICAVVCMVLVGCDPNPDTEEVLVEDDVTVKAEDVPSEETDDCHDGDDTSKSTVVAEYGQLSVDGKFMVNQDGEKVQLRGMSLFWSQWMGQFYTKEAVKWLKDDWNVTIVRASMGVEDSDGYLSNPEKEKAKVFEVIEAAIEEGIYVLVDWHSHHAEDHLDEAKRFFAEVAEKYGSHPNIIYETYNEPLGVSWTQVLKPYHEAVVAEIRKYDPDNIVVCGTRNWSQAVNEVVGNELNDPNVMYTLHYYASSHKEDLRNAAQVAIDNNIPLFVTEYGVTEYTGNGYIDVESVEQWWKFLDDNSISWCNWSIADKEESSAALRPGASGQGGWSESQLTQSGRMVRAEILAKNPKF